ncbi:hypothetical protein MTR67_013250, partial [Solanum verrucosum]
GIRPSFGNLSLLITFSASKNNLLGKIPDELCQLLNLKYFLVNEHNLSGTLRPCLFNRSSIVAIDVRTNHLDGKLPPLLGITVPNLEFLSIYRNNVTGNIPVTLSNATNLQSLIASRNGLTGKVPPLGNLLKMWRFFVAFNYLGKGEDDDLSLLTTLVNPTSLELLELNTNNFGGLLPASISNLSTELIELSLSYNQISGEIPRWISNLKKLQAFFVAYNRFHGEIPSEIGDLIYLQELALLGNQFSGQIPISLGNLASLTKLSLRENNLQGRIPSSLGKCYNLELLDLGSNNLSGFIPSEILELSFLSEGVDQSQNHLTGFLSMEIGKLRNLGYLNLSDNKLQGQIPTSIGTCVKLEALDLNNNNFQGSIPSTINSLRVLGLLVLSHNNLSGGIPGFLKDFKFLQILNLSSNTLEELDLPACVVEVKKERKSGFPLKIIDRMTKSAHFLSVKTTNTVEDYAKLDVEEIVRLHGVPISIISDRERTIQTLEDMLKACVIDFKGNWDDHLPLIEFAYNNSYHSSIQMAPYEALYGRRCRSPIGWFEVGEAQLIGPDLVHQAMEKVKVIQERLKTAQSCQKSYTDVRRRELEFEIDD